MSAALSATTQRSAWQVSALGVVLAAALGGLAYLLALSWPILFPKPVFSATATPGCDLNAGPCAAAFDARRFIRLTIDPQRLTPSDPLPVLVDTAGLGATTVDIEFSGVDMNMGLISHALHDAGDGTFAGDAILPVCIRGRMTWRATVSAQGTDGLYRATFDFEVSRR